MSIFKDTIKGFVQDQLEARKNIISQAVDTGKKDKNGNPIYSYGTLSRADDFLRYTTGKNSWVRMSSFVDCVDIVKGKDGKPYDQGVKIGSKRYFGSELARKYILEGGTLYETKDANKKNTGKFTLRSGVARERGVYASNIDLGGTIRDGSYRPFGYRPMPGITSIEITNKSAYGSLREAVVKFYAWDKHQLEELELLYMRTGYTVLLEWGWSQYLKSGFTQDNKYQRYSKLDDIRISNFDYPTLDIFSETNNAILNPPKDKTSDEIIYDYIENLQFKTCGNYDAMLGHVKNFSWSIMPNGGFECTTVLISRGEILTGLKLNSNAISFIKNPIDGPPLSLFEQIFLNRAAQINNSEFNKGFSNVVVGQFASGSGITTDSVTSFSTDLTTRLSKTTNLITYDNSTPSVGLGAYPGVILQTNGFDGTGIEYISMSDLITILNLYFNIKDQKSKIISQIVIPKGTPCLASVDSVSIDPGTCIIRNSQAKFITQTSDGFNPKTLVAISLNETGARSLTTTELPEFLLSDSTNLGNIGNIYIAIPKILEIYRSKGGNNTDIMLIPFLQDLLSQVSKALGGINDFQLHTTKSTVQIIDVKYLEKKGNKKYEFDLIGLKSICRDIKITSRIFESQSTMIAVGAGARSNVGDVYSSTQNYLNKGLRDRILKEKLIEPEKNAIDTAKEMFNNIVTLSNYLTKITGTIVNPSIGNQILYPTSQEVTNASALLKTYQYQFNSTDVDFKAIIPFELEIVLDGIAGFVQGQVFTINRNILPQTYINRNIGFIITGIAHSLQNNDWITTIKTQCCLLDNEEISRVAIPKDQLKFITAAIEQRKRNIFIWSALADYMVEVWEAYKKVTDLKLAAEKINQQAASQSTFGLSGLFTEDPALGDLYNTITKYFLDSKNILGEKPVALQKIGNKAVPVDFKGYYKLWAAVATKKYPDANVPQTFDDAKVVDEIDGKLIPLPIIDSKFEDFISYPVYYNPEGTGTKLSAKFKTGFGARDYFFFRSPEFIDAINSGEKLNKYYLKFDPNANSIGELSKYPFLPNALKDSTIIKPLSNNKDYRAAFPVNAKGFDRAAAYTFIYDYICREAESGGYWESVSAQYRPTRNMQQYSIH
jgi:hypothetical protein